MSDNESPVTSGCPVIHMDFRLDRPALETYETLDELREAGPVLWNDTEPHPYWMVTRYDAVREALQRPDVFTNDVVSVLSDPERGMRLIPQNLNPPEHVWYRHVVNPWFSARSIRRVDSMSRARCIELIEELVPVGRVDLTVEFALQYPTEVFFELLGLPAVDGFQLLPAVEGVFRGFFGGPPDEMVRDLRAIRSYFKGVIEDRSTSPRDPSIDFVSFLLQSEVNHQPITRDEVLSLCLTILLAGLDTTRSAIGYIFHHLATHPDHRRQLIDNPDKIPAAVEEFLRLYSLVIQDGRSVAQDIEFHGCRMRKGDIVWLGLAQANRDSDVFDRPDEFILDRPLNRHLSFGAGGHHCLGASLARVELATVLEEWLKRIPDFQLDEREGLMERGGQLMLLSVPLTWQT